MGAICFQGAILNAVWDLWAKMEKKPLWELVVDMEPEVLVNFIDFKHMTDFIDKEEALKNASKYSSRLAGSETLDANTRI